MGRDHEMLAVELVAHDLRTAYQLGLLFEYLPLGLVIVAVLLLVDEG